jgi:hypothetical protein
MDKPLTLAGVKFLHSNHLNRDEAKNKPAQERLAKLTEELKTSLGAEHFSELEAVAKESGHAADRHAKMSQLVKQWTVPVETEVLAEFTTLQHRQVRISQLNDLQCTNCHAYSSPKSGVADNRAEHHFHVSTTTCFTCHFNNEAFNTGTSECLSCHSPPQQEITVHAEVRGEGGEKLGAKLVKMNHAEILAKKVDCVACHADAIRDDATVSRRDCERCHDQPRFFEDYAEPFSLDLVNRYHEVHIERQKAKCVDCHSEIQHRLIPDNGEQSNADFLTSSLANCAQCHPNHHAAQVDLLMGRGGLTVPKSEPNLMFGSRTNCSGCHTQHGKDPHGNSVTKATEAACFACHGDRHKDTFEKWKLGLELVMEDAVAACAAARKKIEETTDAKPEALAQAKKLLEEAEADLQLVRTGNGLHNITYAMELLDAVTTRANQASAALQSTE